MVGAALTASIVYFIVNLLDPHVLAWQALNRPIVLGPLIGLVLGDFQTGIILGASLEAIFMGISSIGAEVPSDPASATVVTVAAVILTGLDTEAGLALAIPIGTIASNIKNLFNPVWAAMAPHFEKLAAQGNIKRIIIDSYLMTIGQILARAVPMFLAIAFGAQGLQSLLASMPPWVMAGIGATGGLMRGVGIAILVALIWDNKVGVFFFLGFVLVQFLNLGTLPIAIIGVVIALTIFFQDKETLDLIRSSSSGGAAIVTEEEGFLS